MDLFIIVVPVFLAGVGLGTFVVGSLIRKIVVEVKAHITAEVEIERQRTHDAIVEVENYVRSIRRAL